MSAEPPAPASAFPGVGDLVGPLEVGPVAHGGHFVARHGGRVVFVRHALPGEQVIVRLTDTSHAGFWRADVVEVVVPSSDRVSAPCAVADRCGGCDFQHVRLPAQRELKTAVLREQLRRLAGVDQDVEVEAVELDDRGGADDGLGWRSRMRYRTEGGRVGLLAHRSHDLVELPDHGCLIASPGPGRDQLDEWAATAPASASQLDVVDADPATVLRDSRVLTGAEVVSHQVLGRRFRVRADGFWQVHPRAAALLSATTIELLDPRAGERALDLYCGVGLFAGALVDRGVRVTGVEISRTAVGWARANVPQATFIAGPLERSLRRLPSSTDLVVLDPPRAGAGRKVVAHVAGLRPRAIVHIGCDPASFATDLARFASHGYRPRTIRAFDLFPMTHHFESIALLEPAARSGAADSGVAD